MGGVNRLRETAHSMLQTPVLSAKRNGVAVHRPLRVPANGRRATLAVPWHQILAGVRKQGPAVQAPDLSVRPVIGVPLGLLIG